MSTLAQDKGSHAVKKNEMVTLEGERTVSLKLFLQGKLDVYISPSLENAPASYDELNQKSYRLFALDENLFISAADLACSCKDNLSIAAADECNLFVYGIDAPEDLWSVIRDNKDYGTYIMNSICHLMSNSYNVLKKVSAYNQRLEDIYENLSMFYIALIKEYDLHPVSEKLSESGTVKLSELKNPERIPFYFDKQLIEPDDTIFCEASLLDCNVKDKLTYYSHMYDIPTDIKKAFFSANQYITAHHITDASACLNQILSKLRSTLCSLDENIKLLYNNNMTGAYFAFVKAASELRSNELEYSTARDAFIYIYEHLKEISSYLECEYNHDAGVDFKYLNHIHKNYLTSLDSHEFDISISSPVSATTLNVQSIPEELKNSAAKIIEYSEISADKASIFMSALNAFINLRDKLSSDDKARKIRRTVSDVFFDVYKAVFKKAYTSNNTTRLIKMFLSFGYMDERLLDVDQVLGLYKLAGMESTSTEPNIYCGYDWFAKIYDMEKDPSVNSFGQDYFDVFREMKKRGKVSDKDMAAYNNNRDDRLSFEIFHMFRTNHKLCQGQLHMYFPILHRDAAPYNPIQSLITPEIVKDKLDKILQIDFSAFHREISYRNPSMNIEKELVMMSVVPDIILMPVYGSRASMWQEITGRLRTSPGRFLIPIFTDESLDSMLIKLVGDFKWELCRTMAGSAWNDVTYSSLTSDYTDYIQFYRKNRDLSTEAKQKIKSLTAKHRSRTREIFVSDYELWINNESRANPRLNKVARGILFKHCPFGIEIREQLRRQHIYADMLAVWEMQREKKAIELERRYNRYLKANNGVWDPVLEDNLKFYRDM